MRWGVWSAICYPLLYACCNVLLLPGGILREHRRRIFFGLWWGFLMCYSAMWPEQPSHFSLVERLGGAGYVVVSKNQSDCMPSTGSGTRGLEAHSPEPVASPLSHKFDELFVRSDQTSFSHMYDLDRDWTSSGKLFCTLIWVIGPIGEWRLARGQTHPRVYKNIGSGRVVTPFVLAILVLMGRICPSRILGKHQSQ